MKLIKTLFCDLLMLSIAPEIITKLYKNKLDKEKNCLSKYANFIINLIDRIEG